MLDKLLNLVKSSATDDKQAQSLEQRVSNAKSRVELLAHLAEEMTEAYPVKNADPNIKNLPLLSSVLEIDPALRHQLLLEMCHTESLLGYSAWRLKTTLANLAGLLINLTPAEEKYLMVEIIEAVNTLGKDDFYTWEFLAKIYLKNLETHVKSHPIDADIRRELNNLAYSGPYSSKRDTQAIKRRIEALIFNSGATIDLSSLIPKLSFDHFSNALAALQDWLNAEKSMSEDISKWILTCLTESSKTRPTDKWLGASKVQLKGIEEASLVKGLSNIMLGAAADFKALHKADLPPHLRYGLQVPDWLSCVAWFAGFHLGQHTEIRMAIDQLASAGLKKYPGIGPLGGKIGNACLRAFSLMPGMEGISALFRYKNKAINRNVIKLTETLLNEAATRQHMTRSDLEDLSVPTFGLNADQIRVEQFGECQATLRIVNNAAAQLEWTAANGKPVKSVPSAVKDNYKDELKRFQLAYKELQGTLSAQYSRIENAYLQQRTWRFADFTARYLQHPVLKILATRLIWRFEENGQQADAIFYEGKWQNCRNESLNWLSDNTTVQLWHPISSEANTVLQWREWLMDKSITQPFKQAYREIYVVTPPEIRTNTYSNRFAAHILRQHQFSALAGQRDWHYTLQGNWDSHNTPYRKLDNWNYSIEFWVEALAENAPISDSGIFMYVNTDQVRFLHGGRVVNMADVPALLFSELMRDVDLFVGVCSIGNDPNWSDTGDNRFNNYWQSYAFSEELAESGKMRRAALERLIPRLKIGPKCHFTDKFLVVNGTKHEYKIHCGSGNILMSPNDKYLCIVPDASAKQTNVFLPFEGDRMLSIIISKAQLLADDDKITDATILRQL